MKAELQTLRKGVCTHLWFSYPGLYTDMGTAIIHLLHKVLQRPGNMGRVTLFDVIIPFNTNEMLPLRDELAGGRHPTASVITK